jgi:hypothetical protein
MRDFTIITYTYLLEKLEKQGFSFQTFTDFIVKPKTKTIVLRHDVDDRNMNSLQFARIQNKMGIVGSYFFRIVPQSFNADVIKEIAGLGHEIGYHYEDLIFANTKLKVRGSKFKSQGEEFEKKIVEIGIESFKMNLEKFRKIVPVNSICMHGSPMSRWDNRLLWKYYDYHDFGLIGEPYFDINFDEVLYLTDTGRRWDGSSVSVRDKNVSYPSPKLHTTFDLIKAAEEDRLPEKMMMTFHPQRWTDKTFPWVKELVLQNIKNTGKYFLIKIRV